MCFTFLYTYTYKERRQPAVGTHIFSPPLHTHKAPTDPTGKDFWVDRPTPHVIHLLGIESPGLTASLALADYVVALSEK